MKNLIIILSLIILFTNCTKTKSSNYLKGQLALCYNGIKNPYSNKHLELYQKKNGSNTNAQILTSIKTDAYGNFNFDYVTTNTSDKLIIRESSLPSLVLRQVLC